MNAKLQPKLWVEPKLRGLAGSQWTGFFNFEYETKPNKPNRRSKKSENQNQLHIQS